MKTIKGTLRSPGFRAAFDRQDAETMIQEIGEQRREVMRIEAAMNDAIAGIKKEHEQRAQPLKAATAERIQAVQVWAEANRDELTRGGKVKTVALATGECSWRVRPPRVTLRGKDKILQSLHSVGLDRFIRFSEDVDKEALLREPEVATQVQGISIGSGGEDFSISPYEMEIEGKQ